MVGNLGLVVLIYMERRLHTPMYIFLSNLALMDSCMVQFYFLGIAETTDCFLLAAMAYDRYVAICNPLQYHTMMSMKLCFQMIIGAYIAGNVHTMIEHFFCDLLPLYRLSCTDPYINELILFILAGSIQIFTITIVLMSYFCILLTIFKMKSKEGRGKALSTCVSHFLSVSIFYGSLHFMYAQPHSVHEGDKDIPVAIFYTLVIPLLNPFIYSLRNKEIINVMKRAMKK
ncbi:Olfactory receptor 5K3 [Lemmus lemmus]